MRRWSLREDSV
ncbi:unnamed protein product, partial [Allacma fusca]